MVDAIHPAINGIVQVISTPIRGDRRLLPGPAKEASNRFTVVEVNAKDRPALLNRLARALFEAQLVVHSAHIATYGERAADTFYVTDLFGHKVDRPDRLRAVEDKLLAAANAAEQTGDARTGAVEEYTI